MRLGGLPLYVGKIGHTTIETMAQRTLERIPGNRCAALVLGKEGDVWIDEVDAASVDEMVGVYRKGHDRRALVDDIECEARKRGFLLDRGARGVESAEIQFLNAIVQ